jgi:cytochrome c553
MFNSFPVNCVRFLLSAILLAGNALSVFSVEIQEADTVFGRKDFSAEELVRAERLFYGLAYPEERSVNCVRCHNTRWSDTLNWNPDALEISRKYLYKNAADLKLVLLRPAGKKMTEVHKGFQLTNEDILLIKAYMDRLVNIGLKQHKPVVTNLLLLIISFVLFIISSADIVIKRLFRNRRINWIILSITSIVITWILAVNAIAFGRSRDYSPDQPVKFSHAVHAGQNKTDCNYCHYSARSSKTAGIPPGNVCLNCHFLVKSGTRSGVTEINKVTGAYDSGKAIEWIRIYRLPDFVFFSHAQHVTVGGISCEACHGDVKTMDRLYQVPDLSMGWCLKCHDTRKVNLTNEYYKTYFSGFYEDFQAGKIDSVMVSVTGGRNCGNCHY